MSVSQHTRYWLPTLIEDSVRVREEWDEVSSDIAWDVERGFMAVQLLTNNDAEMELVYESMAAQLWLASYVYPKTESRVWELCREHLPPSWWAEMLRRLEELGVPSTRMSGGFH